MRTQGTARTILMNLGSEPSLATVALPYVWMLPGTTDPDAQGVIEIVKAVQRGLRGLGHKVMVSGVLDRPTAQALDVLVPPKGSWPSTTWIVIMQKIQRGLRYPRRVATEAAVPMGLGGYYGYGPIPGRMVGLPAGPLGGVVQEAAIRGAVSAMAEQPSAPKSAGVEFVVVSGVAKPKNPATLGIFQGLQRAINVGRRAEGLKTIGVDGDIGTNTLTAAKSLKVSQTAASLFTSTSTLARNAASAARLFAGAYGAAPDFSSSPGTSSSGRSFPPVSSADAAAQAGSPPGFFAFLDQFPGGKFVPFIALGVGAAWLAVRMRKGKKARAS